MPGLVDLHTHVYHGATYWGIEPDPVAARTGVTTWLDVGSAGAWNVIGLRDFVARKSQARIYAYLNISGIGLTAPTWESANLGYLDVPALLTWYSGEHKGFMIQVGPQLSYLITDNATVNTSATISQNVHEACIKTQLGDLLFLRQICIAPFPQGLGIVRTKSKCIDHLQASLLGLFAEFLWAG